MSRRAKTNCCKRLSSCTELPAYSICVCNYKNDTKTHFLLAELKSLGSNHNVVTVCLWLAKVVHSFIYFPMTHIFACYIWLAVVVILFCHILFRLCYIFYTF